MRSFVQFFRLIHIKYVLIKYGLDLRFIFSMGWFRPQKIPNSQSIRLAMEELGPLFIKFGQILSTRKDILSSELAEELSKLQDKVSPFDGLIAKKIIETSLGGPVEHFFSDFQIEPLASASISQVHLASLMDGTNVVVKVLRPNIHQYIERDCALLRTLAKLIQRYIPTLRRFRPIEVVAEIERTLYDELDLLREAANASQLRRNFSQTDILHIPKVFWEYSRKNVLVIEKVHGVAISDIHTLKAKNVDLKCLAERGVEIFFTQVFRDCFFHADMHPGNIFVNIDNPQNPQYIAVDFGIMGALGPEDQRYLGENFLAFFKRDYRRVAELHIQSGWVPKVTSITAFESAIRTVCEPIFEKPLKDISFSQTLLKLFQTARQFNMEVQPQLLLLQKTLFNIEGLGRELYPELDLWQTAKPYLEKWMKKQYGPRAFLKTLKNKIPLWSDKLPEIPEAIYHIMQPRQYDPRHLIEQWLAASSEKRHLSFQKNLSVKIFGATLMLGATLVAIFSLPTSFLLLSKEAWVLGSGLVGLFCLFKS